MTSKRLATVGVTLIACGLFASAEMTLPEKLTSVGIVLVVVSYCWGICNILFND
jgi:hypothetical protein